MFGARLGTAAAKQPNQLPPPSRPCPPGARLPPPALSPPLSYTRQHLNVHQEQAKRRGIR